MFLLQLNKASAKTLNIYLFFIVSLSIMHITTLAIVSRFPNIYIKTQMYGSAFSSISGALLQIFCLYLGHGNHTRTALIYFICGLTVLAFTVYCAVMCKYIPRLVAKIIYANNTNLIPRNYNSILIDLETQCNFFFWWIST